MDRSTPTRQLVAVLGITGLIAVSAGGASIWAAPRLGRPDSAVLLGVLALAGLMSVGVVRFVPRRRTSHGEGTDGAAREDAPVPPPFGAAPWALPVFAVVFSAVSLFAIARLPLAVAPDESDPQVVQGDGEGTRLLFEDGRDQPVRVREAPGIIPPPVRAPGPPLVLIVLVAVLGGAALVAGRRARKRRGEETSADVPGVDAEVARRGILRSIDAMLADPNPDTAVIGAYARLLEGLAAAGAPRRDFEGPVEHLRRALARLEVRPGPARRLVELFEVARFSDRSLTPRDRDRALEALRQAFSDLGGDASAIRGVGAAGRRP